MHSSFGSNALDVRFRDADAEVGKSFPKTRASAVLGFPTLWQMLATFSMTESTCIKTLHIKNTFSA